MRVCWPAYLAIGVAWHENVLLTIGAGMVFAVATASRAGIIAISYSLSQIQMFSVKSVDFSTIGVIDKAHLSPIMRLLLQTCTM